jgi:hypothetical protein
VPADPSSPIPAALAHLTCTDPRELQDTEARHLLAYLAAVPDPRATRGRRHPWAPSWPWPPRRCWPAPGRSPRSPNRSPMRPSRSGPRWAPAATLPTTSRSQPRPPSAGPWSAWTPTRWPAPSAPGWPTRTVPDPQPANGGRSPSAVMTVPARSSPSSRVRGACGPPVWGPSPCPSRLLGPAFHRHRSWLLTREPGRGCAEHRRPAPRGPRRAAPGRRGRSARPGGSSAPSRPAGGRRAAGGWSPPRSAPACGR